VCIGAALTPQSAPKVDPAQYGISVGANSGFGCCTGVNFGRQKGSIFGARYSHGQIAANRANAQKSTGPKTAAGKLKSSGNSRRHGLSISLAFDTATTEKADTIARMLIGHQAVGKYAAAAVLAQAQLELLRIRGVRAEFRATVDLASGDTEALRRLAALDRYERFAHTKRWRASKSLLGEGGRM
jgi:hypothetical protein